MEQERFERGPSEFRPWAEAGNLVGLVNPPRCPSCNAPLEPLSTRCTFCNFVTPLGQLEAERALHEARAREAQSQAYAAQQASMAQAAAAREVARKATWALVATGLAFFICCGPMGWLGAFFAWRSLSLAGKHGIAKPASAYVSLVLAALGTLMMVFVIVVGRTEDKKKEERLGQVEARSKAGRTKEPLDPKIACDIVEIHLLKEGRNGAQLPSDGTVTCAGGAFASRGTTARLDGIHVEKSGKSEILRACFGKSARWYLLDLAPEGDCPDDAPRADTEADEKRAREEFAQLTQKGKLTRVTLRLADAKAAVGRASSGPEKACPESALVSATKGGAGIVHSVDYAVLDGKAEPDWAFLSDASLTKFLAKGTSLADRNRLAAELSGDIPLLVVYREKKRSLPEVTDKGTSPSDFGLVPGEYEGTLFVVELGKGEILCQGPLSWKTHVKPAPFSLSRSRTSRSVIEGRAEQDFKARFHDAATERIKSIAGGKIRLGYKPLE